MTQPVLPTPDAAPRLCNKPLGLVLDFSGEAS